MAYYDSETEYIQDKTFYHNAYYDVSGLKVGEGEVAPLAYVFVKEGGKLMFFKGDEGVTIENCFKCEKGAELEIK